MELIKSTLNRMFTGSVSAMHVCLHILILKMILYLFLIPRTFKFKLVMPIARFSASFSAEFQLCPCSFNSDYVSLQLQYFNCL